MNTFRLTEEDRARHRAEQAQARSLATLLPAQPAAAAPEPPVAPDRRPASLVQLLLSAAAVLAIAAIVVYVVFRPSAPAAPNGVPTTIAAPTPPPAAAPTEGATVDAYAAPGGTLLGPIPADSIIKYRYGNTSWGGVDWHGRVVWIEADHPPPASYPDLARPTPAPTVERVYVEVPIEPPCDQAINPRYTAQIDVYDGSRPIGIAVGRSCISQADAQANADALAAAMKGATP